MLQYGVFHHGCSFVCLAENGEITLTFVTADFVTLEKKTVDKDKLSLWVRIKVEEMDEVAALKMAVESFVGESVDVEPGTILYIKVNKNFYEGLKCVLAGTTIAFEIKLRHLEYFSAPSRVQFVLESFNNVHQDAHPLKN